jgi:hypothetical protein
MTNIEMLLGRVIGGVILGGFLLCFGHQCFNFVENQSLDNYFMNNDYYEINDNQYLLKKQMNLCGNTYQVGEIIDKNTYDYCINK